MKTVSLATFIILLLSTVMVIVTPVGIELSGFISDFSGINLYFAVSGVGLVIIAGIYLVQF